MNKTGTQTLRESALHSSSIEQARQLVQLLETGKTEEANQNLNELCQLRETELYQDIGKLTRDLHEAFHALNTDEHLHVLMKADMSDAKEHLDYVIQTTESSAHETLGAIEHCTPVIEGIANDAAALHEQLRQLMPSAIMDENIFSLAGATDAFLSKIETDFRQIRASFKVVLTAQEYQDVTGQILQRVIGILHQLEMKLVDILRASASDVAGKTEQAGRAAKAEVKSGDDKMNQDDVDDLLDSLGF